MATKDNMQMVKEAATSFDPRARVIRVPLLDVQRMSEAPVVDVRLSSESHASVLEELCRERGWEARRSGPFNVIVDPTPGYVSGVNENYDSVWSDD